MEREEESLKLLEGVGRFLHAFETNPEMPFWSLANVTAPRRVM